jgi:IclR family transcriptional regulator, acetate operon repressor
MGKADPGRNNSIQAGSIRALRRAMAVLSYFIPERRSATLTELARETNLATTTVARILATLEAEQYIRRQGDGRYRIGSQLVRLALMELQGNRLYEIALGHLQRLSEETGETANLAIQDENGDAYYVRQVPSRMAIRHESWLGRRLPAQGSVNGAALRGEVGPEGYAFSRQTLEKDVVAVAAPVLGPDREICGAFSVTGPSFRITEDDIKRIGNCVVREARAASAQLGAWITDE